MDIILTYYSNHIWYYLLTFAYKITPITEFEVINRFVDVDGTNKMAHILEVIFFVDVDGTLSDFMRTILVYLFCGFLCPTYKYNVCFQKHK